MPNIIIETSRDDLISKTDNLMARINDALWQSKQFAKPEDIKTRIYTPNNCLIGLASGQSHDFIYVHFYLMPGRDDTTIKGLAQAIADAVKAHFAEFEPYQNQGKLQICVNPMILNHNYCKEIL